MARQTPAPNPIDIKMRAALADATASMSPQSILLAWLDWASHLAISPGKQAELSALALAQASALAGYLRECLMDGPGGAHDCIEPPALDRRFAAEEWRRWPFNLWHQAFLLNQRWWEEATRGVRGVDPHHENVVAFAARQWLDMFSPGNQLLTNPVALKRTVGEGGANLLRGQSILADNVQRLLAGRPPAGAEDLVVGRDVAATPGKVVLRNRLIELIQYVPATRKVHPQPVLIVPAWIMKYYILDLSPHNSLVKYLVDQGHTVFCISWKNPGAGERDLGMDEYLDLGFRAALDAVNAIVPKRKVHATGYCLGGTLLAATLGYLAAKKEKRIASATFMTALVDFTAAGELEVFIDEGQVASLERKMNERGYLEGSEMATTFNMLRANDLIWSFVINNYLLGRDPFPFDLLHWNCDSTRMPAAMHSYYLRNMYMKNALREPGALTLAGVPMDVTQVTTPTYCVAAIEDHIAPWKTTYETTQILRGKSRFVLSGSGHIAGMINPPAANKYGFWTNDRVPDTADAWFAGAKQNEGSWWSDWRRWLTPFLGREVPARVPGKGRLKVIEPAPGTYARIRADGR